MKIIENRFLTACMGLLFFLCLSIFTLSAQIPGQSKEPAAMGTMVFMDGIVDVHRNGEIMDWELVDIGLEIENYDLVETDEDSFADIELTTPSSRGVTVHINENTAFYFDSGEVDLKQQTRFEMLAGSLSLKVQKLTGTGEVIVKTPTVVLGVRGTEFDITAAPEGSFLITCVEGAVSCRDDSGAEQIAQAGRVVEKTESDFRGVAVRVEDLDQYRTNWMKEKEEIFKAGAPFFVRFYAEQYDEWFPKFVEAFSRLNDQSDIFGVWIDRKSSGTEASMSAKIQERREVSSAVFNMRSIFPYFEQIYYRLKVLQRFHEQGIGITQISRRQSSESFFYTYEGQQIAIERAMARVRYYFKLYALNSDNSLVDEIFSDSNPIEGSGPPKPSSPGDL
jgi:hypothetical protein